LQWGELRTFVVGLLTVKLCHIFYMFIKHC